MIVLDIAVSGSSGATDDERAFLARLQAGEEGAIDQLCEAYVPRLYRFIWHAVGGDSSDIEDILQETMLASLRTLQRFRGECTLYTWLCAVARHKIQDHIRRQQRRRARVMSEPLDDLKEAMSSAPSFEGQIAQQHALEQALQDLPMDYRTVLMGKYIEGFTVSELAQIMDRSQKSVESLLTRARTALRTRLASLAPEER